LNERIKQLAVEANLIHAEQSDISICYEGWNYSTDNLEKFAELIISKCIELMDENYRGDMYTGDVYASEYNNCINEQVETLEDYFGVNK
jgi:hypothetical protein